MYKTREKNFFTPKHDIHAYPEQEYYTIYEATLSETQCVTRWRLLLEQYGAHIHHIAGADSIAADTLNHIESSNAEEDENDIFTTAERYMQALEYEIFELIFL